MKDTLAEYLSSNGKTQLHIAETEKYAHVTFFFNGGREEPFPGEERTLVASPKVATYDLKPEMSAYEVKDKLVAAIKENKYDFIVVNYANGDMVGHTGVYEAIEKAVVAIDNCVRDTVEAAKANGYEVIIIADHDLIMTDYVSEIGQGKVSAFPAEALPVFFCAKTDEMDVQIELSWKRYLAAEFEKPYFANLTNFVRREYHATTCYPRDGWIFNASTSVPSTR